MTSNSLAHERFLENSGISSCSEIFGSPQISSQIQQILNDHPSQQPSSFNPNSTPMNNSDNSLNTFLRKDNQQDKMEFDDSVPLITTTLTPFHLNCNFTKRKICHCTNVMTNQQVSFFRDIFSNNQNNRDNSLSNGQNNQDIITQYDVNHSENKDLPNQLNTNNEISNDVVSQNEEFVNTGSVFTHELYLLWKRRFPQFEERVLRNQKRINEDAFGNLNPSFNDSDYIQDEILKNHSISGSMYYISIPKYYFDNQEKIVGETNLKNVDQRRKMERMIFVPLQKQDGQWLPMKWDLWRLETWLRNVHGPEKSPQILREMLTQGRITTHEEVEQIIKQKRAQQLELSQPNQDIHHERRVSQMTNRFSIRPNSHPRSNNTRGQFTNLIPYTPPVARK